MSEGHRLHESRVDAHAVEPAGPYSVAVETEPGGVTVIVLTGELDMAATDPVRAAVDGAAGALGVVIDVTEVTFVDSSMLKELLRAGSELSRYGTRLVLAGIPSSVRRLLDLTRTARLFTEAEDRAAGVDLLRSKKG